MNVKEAIQTLLPGTYCYETADPSFQIIFKHPKGGMRGILGGIVKTVKKRPGP